MKSWMPLIILCVFGSLTALTKEEKTARKPNSENLIQVQICEGTLALGNEGGGVGVSALINVNNDSCELGLAYSYEYGNDRGLKLGKHQPFNVYPVQAGKTECFLKKEGDKVFITVQKATRVNPKKPGKVLVQNCEVTDQGF